MSVGQEKMSACNLADRKSKQGQNDGICPSYIDIIRSQTFKVIKLLMRLHIISMEQFPFPRFADLFKLKITLAALASGSITIHNVKTELI